MKEPTVLSASSCAASRPRPILPRSFAISSTTQPSGRRSASTRARTVMPFYELRTKLGMEGRAPEQIAAGLQAAYAKGELPKRNEVSFAYMWSADQNLGGGVGHWHPHMMVFSPYYENSLFGNNPFGAPL